MQRIELFETKTENMDRLNEERLRMLNWNLGLEAQQVYWKQKKRDLSRAESYDLLIFGESGIQEWRHGPGKLVDGKRTRPMDYYIHEPKNLKEYKTNYPIGQIHLIVYKKDGTIIDFINVSNCAVAKRSTIKKPKTTKANAFRAAAQWAVSTSSSSSEEESKASEATQEKTDQEPSQKAIKKNSKHQGKAKTFKRKTKRRGRV